MKINKLKLLSAIAATTLSVSANAAIITNGGFESGDLTGWTCTGADLCAVQSDFTHSGSYAVWGFDNSGFGTLSQTFATTAGSTYDLEFWTNAYNTSAGNILRYSIDALAPVTVDTTTDWLYNDSSFVATSTSTTLSFLFETDSGTGQWRIDDVAVNLSSVPVPAAVWLFGSGLIGLAGFARRKKA